MTAQDCSLVGKRLLGVFFLVQGCVHAASVLRVMGIVVPEGSSRAGHITGTLVEAAILLIAGAILARTVQSTNVGGAAPSDVRLKQATLQLLGVYFFISGLVSLSSAVVDTFFVEAGWSFRAGEYGAAAVESTAGALLVVYAARVSEELDRYASV